MAPGEGAHSFAPAGGAYWKYHRLKGAIMTTPFDPFGAPDPSQPQFLNPQMNPVINPRMNPTLNPQANPMLNPQANPMLNPKANPLLNPWGEPEDLGITSQ